eukprot:Plantae.Rhodophyta-Hildenbrandia_rubra.ctg8092.p1 GENE.Plantae.Rhodophyta-Hildenbrandia_rubra.ctg8092~~Plantae.Rhodophyta-Hildenbrandia_rubra.ctg8092.p1  ORF type:complete len:304 (+),score=27.95 Plantae.Rhodophyta-Hildenbrandia_rubra.ctg8092:81-992(+)
MSEESARKAVKLLCKNLVELQGPTRLSRRPNAEELRDIEQECAAAGFPGRIGCVDCMKQLWASCPKALKGQRRNPKGGKLAVISAEAWRDRSLYVWRWLSGRPGANNNLNALGASPLFNDILRGEFIPDFERNIHGSQRSIPCFLADGIYPRWSLFATPISAPTTALESTCAAAQEQARKGAERRFGALQARLGILRQERKEWRKADVILLGAACVILHNLIVKMSRGGLLGSERDDDGILLSSGELLNEFFEGAETESSYEQADETLLESLLGARSKRASVAGLASLRELLKSHLGELQGLG